MVLIYELCLTYICDTGQQHDISECMDNILFQVEAALASEKHASSTEESNLVKR